VGCQVGHPPAAAGRTEAAALAREGNQDLVSALVAAEACETACEGAAERNSRSSRSTNAGRPAPAPRALASTKKLSRCPRSTRWSTPFSGCRRTYGRRAPPSYALSTRAPVESPVASTRPSHERVSCQVDERASSQRNHSVRLPCCPDSVGPRPTTVSRNRLRRRVVALRSRVRVCRS
jgi:hypothetical protein